MPILTEVHCPFFPAASSRLLNKATARKEAGICGGVAFAHTPTYADSPPSG